MKSDRGLPKSQLYAMLRAASNQGLHFRSADAPDTNAGLEAAFAKWKSRAGDGNTMELSDLNLLDPKGAKAPVYLSLAMAAMLWDYLDVETTPEATA
jgi:hypothetical protein